MARKYSPAGSIVWQNAFTKTAQSDDVAGGMNLDVAGNVLVTGQTSATASPEQPIVPFLVTFNPDGQIGFSITDASAGGTAVTSDTQSNIYVTGTSAPEFSTPYSALTKFSSSGTMLWTRPIPDTSAASVNVYRIAVNAAGISYAAGTAVDRSTSTRDFLTIKLSAAGDQLWQHRYNGAGNGNDELTGMVVNPAGDLLVAGTAWGGYVSSGGTDNDIVTLRYAKDGVPGSTQAPVAPANLAAQSVTSTQATLRCEDRSADETGFRIERCTGNRCANFSQVGQVGPGVTTYRDATVAKNATYSYRVFAVNGVGASAASNVVTVQTPKK